MRLAILLSLAILAGCAQPVVLTKPFVVCRISDGKALIEQGTVSAGGTTGVGLAQELPDADVLCAKPKS